jgi:hypothetical protein
VTVGNDQWDFLIAQLTEIKKQRAAQSDERRGLILAVHHPVFSGGGGHSGSKQMQGDLDDAFARTKIMPDVVLSGHAHNYQRFTRTVTDPDGASVDIPYLVAGNGGHAITGLKAGLDGSPVQTPLDGSSATDADQHSLRQYFDGFGHLVVTVTRRILTIDLIGTHTNTSKPVDSVTVDLNTRKITHETPPFAHPAIGEKEKFKAD